MTKTVKWNDNRGQGGEITVNTHEQALALIKAFIDCGLTAELLPY